MIDITKIKSGDLLLVHTKGFQPISWAIRKLTGSYWNHVGTLIMSGTVLTKDGLKCVYEIIESIGRGITRESLNKYLNEKKYAICIKRVKVSSFRSRKRYNKGLKIVLQRAYDSIGKRYDYGAIVYLGIKYLTRGFLRKIIPQCWNPFHSRYRFFCSEAVCSYWKGLSLMYKNLFAGTNHSRQDCSTITPKDIGKSKNVKFITGVNKK